MITKEGSECMYVYIYIYIYVLAPHFAEGFANDNDILYYIMYIYVYIYIYI